MSGQHSPGPWRWVLGRGLVDGNGVGLEIRSTSMSEPTATSEANEALIAAAPEMEALLRDIEWAAVFSGQPNCCPSCARTKEEGHISECSLGGLLARIDAARKA